MQRMTMLVLGLFLLPLFFFFGEALAEYGEPTAEEQYLLELINRARANPAEEGQRLASTTDADVQNAMSYFAVNRSAMIAEFNSYPARPPLTFNKKLIDMARFHSADMRDHNYQGHTGSSGDTLTDRLRLFGYDYRTAAENVYSYAKSIFYGHAGFVVDWGVEDLGHRKNVLEFNKTSNIYKEAGLGIVHTVSSSAFKGLLGFQSPGIFLQAVVGPIIITENFALSRSLSSFLLGVAYNDKNGNNFYGIDEGLKGVKIELDNGQSATTSTSGGYSIEINSPGSYIVKATGGGLPSSVTKAVEIASENVKVDFLAQGSQANTLLSLALSKSSYSIGEQVTLYVSVYPGADIKQADVYMVLLYPDMTWRSIVDIYGSLGEQNKAVALAKSWPVTEVSSYPLFQKAFRATDQKGGYQLFLILVNPDSNPLDISNWLTYKDVSFSLQ